MANRAVTFVGDSRYDVSSAMHMAFDQSKRQYNLDPKWISVEECLKIDKSKLLKTDVFVLENFSGPAFDHLQNCKAVIIGTRCLLKCLSRDKELNSFNHPTYSLAMEGMEITSARIRLNHGRQKMQQYIEWMGGVYDKSLYINTTHLVTNSVTGYKYSKAGGKIPIMCPEWIEAVWEASNRDTIFGDCDEFLKESLKTYRLKPFHGLRITSAGLPKMETEKLKMCIDANGGTYIVNYRDDIDVLVLTHSGVSSAKYQTARAVGKECVTPDWIYDCDSAAYAIPKDKYRVGAKSSTRTKSDQGDIKIPFYNLNI